MTLESLPLTARRALRDMARTVRRASHKPVVHLFDEDGVKRAERGGAYKYPDREALGYTGDEVLAVRALLRLHGITASVGQAEGLLQQALVAHDEPRASAGTGTNAVRQAKARARAREAGLCTTCKREQPRQGRTTCDLCIHHAACRVEARRERAKTTERMTPR